MKRFRILFLTMIVVVISLTGCGKTNELPYPYDQAVLEENAKGILDTMLLMSDSYRKYTVASGEEPFSSAVAGLMTAMDEAGSFEAIKHTEFKANDNDIRIVLTCAFSKNDVEVSYVYQANEQYEYRDVFTNADQVLPYIPTEITVQSVFPKSYYLKQAGMNTLMGMGTVFLVLIFISIIISFFKYIPMLLKKKDKKKIEKTNTAGKDAVGRAVQAQATAIGASELPRASSDAGLMNDNELVAVITAAIYAAEAANGNAVSKDTLVVRSISRARR